MTTEYLRRNLLHCKSIGAHGIAVSALDRLRGMKHPPRWIVQAFEGVRDRSAELPAEMAAWRNSAPDNPHGVREHCPTCGADEPYTGACGTSKDDTRALCRRSTPGVKGDGNG